MVAQTTRKAEVMKECVKKSRKLLGDLPPPKLRPLPFTAVFEFVTPALAVAYMASQFRNKRLKKKALKWMVRLIKTNQWIEGSPMGIVFDSTGELRDGQHRLLMIIKSGIPAWLVVYREVDPKVANIIDRNNPRTVADNLRIIDGVERPVEYKSIGSVLYALVTGRPLNPGGDSDLEPLVYEHQTAIYAQYGKCITQLLDTYKHRGEFNKLGYVMGPIAFCTYSRPEDMEDFNLLLGSNANIMHNSPVWHVNSRLSMRSQGAKPEEKAAICKHILCACYAHVQRVRKLEKIGKRDKVVQEALEFFRKGHSLRPFSNLIAPIECNTRFLEEALQENVFSQETAKEVVKITFDKKTE